MRVVFATDRGFAMPTGVALFSLLVNRQGAPPDISLFTTGLDPGDVDRFQGLARDFGARLETRTIELAPLRDLPGNARITLPTYFRLLMPQLLDVPKALYLDGDVFVDGDLAPLWETEVSDVDLAACAHVAGTTAANIRLGLAPDYEYFNAGVLLVNLEAWRRGRVPERAFAFLRANASTLNNFDQDALNVCCEGRVRYLSCVWNFMPLMSDTRFQPDYPAIDFGELKPVIVHFAGRGKPWIDPHATPYAQTWLDYRKRSPWKS